MKKIEIVLTSNLEDIKYYVEDILNQMKKHDEVESFTVKEVEDNE